MLQYYSPQGPGEGARQTGQGRDQSEIEPRKWVEIRASGSSSVGRQDGSACESASTAWSEN